MATYLTGLIDENNPERPAGLSIPVLAAATPTQAGNLWTAIDAIVHGENRQLDLVTTTEVLTTDATTGAVTGDAQAGNIWLVSTTSGTKYTIPTADSSLLATGTDLLDITTALAVGTVLKDKLEAIILDNDDTAIVVDYIQNIQLPRN